MSRKQRCLEREMNRLMRFDVWRCSRHDRHCPGATARNKQSSAAIAKIVLRGTRPGKATAARGHDRPVIDNPQSVGCGKRNRVQNQQTHQTPGKMVHRQMKCAPEDDVLENETASHVPRMVREAERNATFGERVKNWCVSLALQKPYRLSIINNWPTVLHYTS